MKVGSACTAGMFQCQPGAYCNAGKCLEYPTIGGACGQIGSAGSAEIATCLNGYCNLASGAMTGTCSAFLEVGGACSGAGPSPCAPGLFCSSSTGSGTCMASICY